MKELIAAYVPPAPGPQPEEKPLPRFRYCDVYVGGTLTKRYSEQGVTIIAPNPRNALATKTEDNQTVESAKAEENAEENHDEEEKVVPAAETPASREDESTAEG
jgi:hypothetical protein